MTQRFAIQGRLMGLNEYTAANRRNRHAGNKAKREQQDIACWALRAARLKPVRGPVRIRFAWIEKDMRRDGDNISSFGQKVIQDALVECGILPDDSRRWIIGFEHFFEVDRKNPRIVVEIAEE
jgi:Holliday junction resolvase